MTLLHVYGDWLAMWAGLGVGVAASILVGLFAWFSYPGAK